MSALEFKEFGKIPRLVRPCVVTEKLDGTNAQVWIRSKSDDVEVGYDTQVEGDLVVRAGSRNRWISPEDDNYGFARWVGENAHDLGQLGAGRHFGEWWGAGIQRGYGLAQKRFSLFNVARWAANNACVLEGQLRAPECCDVVPVIYRGTFNTRQIDAAMNDLIRTGSCAAPGFMDPEGIIVYHEKSGQLFKITCLHDDEPKNAHVKKEKPPRAPRDPSKGGRRVAAIAIDFPDRRTVA